MRSSQRLTLLAVTVLVLCITFPKVAMADVEGRMPFSHVQYSSAGLGNSGPVRVDVFQNKHNVYKLTVSAFGSLHTVTQARLKVINGYVFNAVGISYSMGYPNVGGRTVYVLLYQVFSTGTEAVAMVVVSEHAAAKVVIIKKR